MPRLASAALCAAALVLSSTGGAVAGSMITGHQVKNGSLTGLDVKDRSLGTRDLSTKAVASLRGARGPRGAAGAARAWAHVSADGTVLDSSPGLTVHRSQPGVYCISAAGLPTPATAVATLDLTDDATVTGSNGPQSFVEVGSLGACGSGTANAAVVTIERSYGGGTTTATYADAGFYVVLP